MIRELAQQLAFMATAAFGRELGITHDTVEWAMSAFAVKITPLLAPARRRSGCQGCPA